MPRPRTRKPRPLPDPLEREVQRQHVQAAALFGITLDRRNTGAARNPTGRLVTFGTPGDSDLTGIVSSGPSRGKRIDVEVKRASFDPRKASGKDRDRFLRQLDRLRQVNDAGGLAIWSRDATDFIRFLQRVMEWPRIRVEFDDHGIPWICDGED